MASTSAASAWRLVLLIGAPLAFAVTGTLHLVPAYEPTTGSDFDHVVPHWKLWTGIHVLQLVIISLLALAIATLTRGVSDSAASVSRVALVPFLAFYSAFDASVGVSGGLLARYVSGHPTTREEVSQAADTVTDPLSAPCSLEFTGRRAVLAGRRGWCGGRDTAGRGRAGWAGCTGYRCCDLRPRPCRTIRSDRHGAMARRGSDDRSPPSAAIS
jgi:hypothetical protein